jgi:hypothetical protein
MLVAGDNSTKAHHPGEEPFDVPATAVPAQRSTVLRLVSAIASVRRNHFDPALGELCVERVTVVGLVADQLFGELVEEGSVECVGDEERFMALTTRNPDGDRKAMAVCHRHDLGRFAASSNSNLKTPLFAPACVPSMYASVRSSFPRARKSSASVVRMRSKTPSRSHFWNRSWHVWYGGYRRGMSAHGAPVRRTQSIPLSTSRGSRHGRPPRGVVTASSGPGTLSRIASHCASVRSMAGRTNTSGDRWKGAPNHGAISITCAAAGCRMRSSVRQCLACLYN